MFRFGVRFSRFSVSSAVLMFGCVPVSAFAASCDSLSCLTTPQANVAVNNGTGVDVGTGGTLTDSTVNHGHIRVWDAGVANGTTIDGDGWLYLYDNATASGSTVENGGMVVVGSATALDTIVNGGDLDVTENAAISDTRLNGGALWVYGDALAKSTEVNNSQMTVYQNGNAERTTVNDGGELSVRDSATVIDTVVNQGGMMAVNAGTHVHFTTVNQGAAMVLADQADASDTTINSGGFLQLKGDAVLGGASHIGGQVAFADPAVNGFHTLTLKGPLTGNGTFLMNTDLAALQGDLLSVEGPVSGTHTLVVADSGHSPSGALQKLMLVDGNGGSGGYTLYGQTVDAGAYRYQLQQQGDDWYLANLAAQDPLNPNVDIPGIQPPSVSPAESLSKGANAAVGNQAASAGLIDAQMNATNQHFGDLRSGKDQGGVWMRGYGVEQHLDTGSSRAFQQQAEGMEIGADTALPFADGVLYVGGLLGKGQGRQDFGEASKGDIDSTTLGAYASYLARSGLYVDGALKYSRLHNDIDITSNLGDKVEARFDNHAVSTDVQIGKAFDLGRGWFVEPQVGLQMARISGGSYTASNGLNVEQDAMNSVQSRVGGMFGRDLELGDGISVKPYAKAAWITEHAGDSQVTVSGAKLDSRLPGSRAEVGGGIRLAADRHSFFAEGGYTRDSDIEQPWAVTLGYRYNW